MYIAEYKLTLCFRLCLSQFMSDNAARSHVKKSSMRFSSVSFTELWDDKITNMVLPCQRKTQILKSFDRIWTKNTHAIGK